MLEKVKAYIPLNFDLMKNPVNWVVITLMVMIAGIGLTVIFRNSMLQQEVNK